jgi:hypothetical protein
MLQRNKLLNKGDCFIEYVLIVVEKTTLKQVDAGNAMEST